MHDLPILHSKPFRIINGLIEGIIIISSASLILLMTMYVLSRYIVKVNIRGFEEIAILIAIWLYFCGAANASRGQSQISADMLDMFVKNKLIISGITVFYRLVGLCIVALLAYLCFDFMFFNIGIGTTTTIWKIPMFFYHSSLVAGFCLMFVYDTLYFIASIKEFLLRCQGKYVEAESEEEDDT